MKRILIAIILATGLLASQGLTAQGTVDKKPLVEIFTASTCPPCVTGNQVLDGVLAYYPEQYTLIKYQMNWPGAGDPYYMEESDPRRAFYEVSGVPHLRTNGYSPGYPQQYTRNLFEQQLTKKTDMSITAEAALNTGMPGSFKSAADGWTVDCHIELKAHADYGTGLTVFMMIVEQKTFGNVGTNGETIFHNVVQAYVISSDGQALEALATDETKTIDLSVDLSGTNTETGNDLSLVVFVQNLATKEVIQSEMVDVSHPFIDYNATITVYDEDFNSVDDGKMSIEMAGSEVIIDSKAHVSKLLPGTYYYNVVVPGMFPYDGEFTITDTDIEQEIFVEIPPFLYYEDFERSVIPEDWTFIYPAADYMANTSGRIVYQKMVEGEVFLILPKIKLDQGVVMSFKVGDSSGRSDVAVGIVSNLEDPGASYTEIVSYEIFNIEGMRTFGARVDDPSQVGDGYLCLKYSSTIGNFFYLDNVILIESQPGYKVQFLVKDQNDEILPETEVIMIDEGIETNTFGCATWRNVDAGEYNYAVSYKGVEFETGTITVDDDILKEVVYNSSGIFDFAKEKISFYPNPATDEITIKGAENGNVRILTLGGQTLIDQSLSNQSQISIRELPVGVYLVKIKAGEKEITQKLLKTQ